MENSQIAVLFDELADLLELQKENPFRVRAYRSVARTVRDLPDRVADLVEKGKDLAEIPNIGDATSMKILEMLETGTCKKLEEARSAVPQGLVEIMRVPGMGPRKTMHVHEALGIQTLEALQKACESRQVRELPGMGEKTEQKILEGIQTVAATSGRMLYKTAAEHVEAVARHLKACKAVQFWEAAGSFRRCKETIGDLDFLVQAKDRDTAAAHIVAYREIAEIISQGNERISVRLRSGLQVDFRFFEAQSFGAALMYFTGSKAHNIAMRKRARDQAWKLNEYGLYDEDRLLSGKTEEAVFKKLGLALIPPELREDQGEIEAAERNKLPHLIELSDIRGDLHCHTRRSDGNLSIEELVAAARRRGYKYVAVTEHSKAIAIANGLDEDALREHADHIRAIAASLRDFTLLAGIEVDVLKSGKLDLDETVLAGLDWVIASIHSHFDMNESAMTGRLLAAIRSGVVHCLGHPLGRLIGRRDPIRFDRDKVWQACLEHHVWIEINAQPERMDLPDNECRRAAQAGLKFSIATDAHKESDLDLMKLGVNIARRAWLEKANVLNTHMLKTLDRGRNGFRLLPHRDGRL